MSSNSENKFIWMDLEMTGLNPQEDHVLEIACLVTNTDLIQYDKGISLIIKQPEEILLSMNDWCKVHHEKSGLINDCRNSNISLAEAEAQVFNYIQSHANGKCTNYLAGNSIYMDLKFLEKCFPSLTKFFHYRLIDVSSLKVLYSHWYPKEFEKISKKISHRALDDIYSSIKELQTYRQLFMKIC